MANFDLSFEKVCKLEYSSPRNALHKNPSENGLTYMGIYEGANPNWGGWDKIKKVLKEYEVVQLASERLYADKELTDQVKDYYKANYWDKFKGDRILPFDIANLIFIFGVNAGMKVAIKKAQRIVGVEADGIVGAKTISALNSFSPLKFIEFYKKAQVEYYTSLATAKPHLRQYLNGWLRRVEKS